MFIFPIWSHYPFWLSIKFRQRLSNIPATFVSHLSIQGDVHGLPFCLKKMLCGREVRERGLVHTTHETIVKIHYGVLWMSSMQVWSVICSFPLLQHGRNKPAPTYEPRHMVGWFLNKSWMDTKVCFWRKQTTSPGWHGAISQTLACFLPGMAAVWAEDRLLRFVCTGRLLIHMEP